MEVTDLNKRIQSLAEVKAREHMRDSLEQLKIATTMISHGNKRGGDGTYFGKESVANFLKSYAEHILYPKSNYYECPEPPQQMINYYADKILDEILTKLPLIKELSNLQEDLGN